MKKRLYGAWATIRKDGTSYEKIFHFFADPELEWVGIADLDGAALSGPHRRWLGEWLSRDGRKARGRRP